MGLLNNNLHALSRHHPRLYEILKECEVHRDINFITSRTGLPVAHKVVNSRDFFLHSRFDPQKEAFRFINAQDIKTSVIFIYGFGCGYHIAELLSKVHKSTKIFVIEPDLRLFKSVIENIDLVKLFANKQLHLLVGIPPQELSYYLDQHLVSIFLGCRIITHEASLRFSTGQYKDISRSLKDYIEFGTTSLYTASAISAQSRYNAFMNLPHALYNPGISQFKNKALGCAAIVIGAGPSLSRNIHLLKKAPAVTIATGTVLKKLLHENVTPHFVCNIDYHGTLTKKYFQNLPNLDKTILISDPRANYQVNDMYPGPVCTWDDGFLKKFLAPFRDSPHGTIEPAATVAQTCFFVAQYLGCDPIITVGLDLSYPGHISHVPGTAIIDQWHGETNRFVSMEDKEWDYFARVRKTMFKVIDMGGNNIYTDRQMFTYLQLFNRLFRDSPQKIIDASEQGVQKEDCETMSLREALKQDFKALDPLTTFKPSELWTQLNKKESIINFIQSKLDQINKLKDLYHELISILEEINDHLKSTNLPSLMTKLEQTRKKLVPFRALTELINELTQADEFQRQKDDQEILLGEYEGLELKQKQLNRDLKFTKGLLGGATYLKEFISLAHNRCNIWPEQSCEGLLTELSMVNEKINRELHR